MLIQNKFSVVIIISTVISLFVIYALFLLGFVTMEHQTYLKHSLSVLFVSSFFFITWIESGKKKIKDLFSTNNLLLFSIAALLVFSINQRIGAWCTAFFAICSLIFLIKNKKWYAINKIYYFVFAYALLRVLGTIGTTRGFYFPDRLLSFFILPLAFSCFKLNKKTCLKLLKLFFRVMISYMTFALISWWYHKLMFDVGTIDWFTKKLAFLGIPSYQWVLDWTYYVHPTYVSLVLIAAFISGFYLYYKKEPAAHVSKFELLLFSIYYFLLIMMLESRIGFVCGCFVLVSTALYYLFLKKIYFKIAFSLSLLIGIAAVSFMDDPISNFVSDNIRKTDYTLAINYIKDHIWWGTGYHEQDIALETQAEKMKDTLALIDNDKTYTHNQFLGEMVQFGIFGLISLIILLIVLFRYAFKTRSYLLQIFLSICFIFMLIEEPLTGQAGITRVMVFLCFFIHISEKKTKKNLTNGL